MDGLPPRERKAAMLAILTAVGLATLDTAITNTALPSIARDLDASGASAIWIVNVYQLVMVATLLPLAALGDILGHRTIYVSGLIVFTVASLACGLAGSLSMLVLARAAQGLGAAGIMSVNGAIIRAAYPSRSLGRGLGLNALIVGLAVTIGPTVASGILSLGTWHWLFLINLPPGFVAIALGLRALPRWRGTDRSFDLVAAGLCAACFGLMILGFDAIGHGGSRISVAAAWLLAAVCGGILFLRQRQHAAPLLAIDLFQHRVFALSSLTAICSFATQGLAFVALPFFLQGTLGRSQIETGWLMTPWAVVVALMAPIAGRLSDRYPVAILGAAGLLALCVGMAALALLPAHPTAPEIIWRMMLCGAGFGFFQSPNLKALLGSAPTHRIGAASGIVAISRLFGQSIGVAFVALCLTTFGSGGPVVALWIGCAFAGIGSVASFSRLGSSNQKPLGVS